ncbi:hypothetical protein HYT74_04060, partial [Candidatus Daviesbacteria bacterium]|nr:hypothetical protein [Candidatus Daviesbacteria bacterium]
FRDIRQYIDGEEELCFKTSCESVNFATSATRVLDEVSFGHQWVIDEGKISDFFVVKQGENFILSYKNEAGNARKIEFLPRDISIDGKISSIDGAILDAVKHQLTTSKEGTDLTQGSFKWSPNSVIFKIFKFLAFLILGCLVPGFWLSKKNFFISTVLGIVVTTLLFYILSFLKFQQGIFIYLIFNLFLLIKIRKKILFHISLKNKFYFMVISLIGIGTVFQQMPVFKNGLHFPYGLGFWGPNTHDGLWHMALINQLMKSVPPENPIFAGEILKNYHYFYDLLVAATSFATGIPVSDLLFRFYPLIFSLGLGIGTYYLVKGSKLAILFSLYLVYFAGSFGWIVEFIKFRHLGGESAFWANQSISFNLNPPFAISLLIVIAILLLLPNQKNILALIILSGTLVAFKAYAALLILLSFLLTGLFKRDLKYLAVFFAGSSLAAVLFFSNFSLGKQLFIFSPFWFIHSMIDSPDRVGWARVTLARVAGWESGNWFKFLAAEAIGLVLFIAGNLGTRVVALFSLARMNLFMVIFALLSAFIPILFIQAGNPWNTIQFLYYFLYISSVVGGIVLAKIFNRGIGGAIFVIILLLVTPINSWATANGYLSKIPHAFVSNQELEALNFLTGKQGVVLTYPYDEKLKNKLVEPWPLVAYDSTSYVSALSGKVAFVEDEGQNQILLTEYKKRLVAAKDFFVRISSGNDFLKDNNIKYIYLPRIFKMTLDDRNLSLNLIFENQEILIYEVR